MKPFFPRFWLVGLWLSVGGCTPAAKPEPKPAPSQEKPAPPDTRYEALPTPGPPAIYHAPQVDKSELGFGATLWQARGTGLPLVSIALVLPLGSEADPKGKEGLTLLTADLLDEGAGKRSALELSDELGRLATDYSSSADVDYVLLSMNALAETLDDSVAILADIVRRPSLTKAEFERRKSQHLAAASAALADPNSRRAVALHRTLFGDGYASSPAQGTLESLKSISHEDVRRQAKLLAVPEGAHFVVVGDVDASAVKASLEKHFSGWKGRAASVGQKAGTPLPPGQAYVVDFPGAAQSALAIATPAGSASDPAFFRELVMNERVGGTFTGRINMNLREDKGYTYGAFSLFRRYRKTGYYAVLTNVVSPATAASIHEVFAELQGLCAERPLTELEYQEAVDGLLLGYAREFATVDSLGRKLASLPIYARPVDYFSTWPTQVQAIGLQAARAAAKPYCDPGSYRVVIAGDRASIQPELEKLGLTVVSLDSDGRPIPGHG